MGALVMEMMERGELDRKLIRKKLSEFLTRDLDRNLFDLPPSDRDKAVEVTGKSKTPSSTNL